MSEREFTRGLARRVPRAHRLGACWRIAAALLPMAFTACGGGDSDSGADASPTAPAATTTPMATTVSVILPNSSPSTAQAIPVLVSVSGAGSYPPPEGVVTLTSGSFNSGPARLRAGAVGLLVPAGVLPAAADTLSVEYTPSAAASARYLAATGSTTVIVAAAAVPTVTAETVATLATAGHPFQALPVDSHVLVAVSSNGDAGSVTGIRVYTAASPTQLTYTCTQPASHPGSSGVTENFALVALPNKLDLALAVGDAGVSVLDRTAAESACDSSEVLVSQGELSTAQGSFAVAVTRDGRYAFVANEYGVVAEDSSGAAIKGNVGVVALNYDAGGHVSSGTLVGQFSTGGNSIANVTLSPDDSRLYITSEIDQPGVTVSAAGNPVLAHAGCVQSSSGPTSTYGLLSVVDVAKVEATPNAAAIIATVASGCSPVRVVETLDGQVIWVAARGDNRVLAFSTHMLESDPDNALLGYGDTGGIAPVGLQLFGHQQLLAVANSNRFSAPAAVGNLTLMAATPVNPTVLQTVAARYFPRTVTLADDRATLYLTDYDSALVQIITTSVN